MRGDESLLATLNSVLTKLNTDDPELRQTIQLIVLTNYETGRIATVQNNNEIFSAAAYVSQVIECYQRWHALVHRLQQGDEQSWQSLYVQLQKWAYRLLERWQFTGGHPQVLYTHAVTCAGDAALVILDKSFPYDVHFERWVYRVLYFICLRHVEAEMNARQDNTGREIVDLDNWEDWLGNIEDPAGTYGLENAELRSSLLVAIDRLASDARKTFILLHYFEQRSLSDIASLLGLEMNAVYKLHYDALRNLRQVWNEMHRSEE